MCSHSHTSFMIFVCTQNIRDTERNKKIGFASENIKSINCVIFGLSFMPIVILFAFNWMFIFSVYCRYIRMLIIGVVMTNFPNGTDYVLCFVKCHTTACSQFTMYLQSQSRSNSRLIIHSIPSENVNCNFRRLFQLVFQQSIIYNRREEWITHSRRICVCVCIFMCQTKQRTAIQIDCKMSAVLLS